MGVFELEGTTLQGKDFRDHLDKNWTNGNQALANLNSLYGTNAAGKATFAPSGVVSTATDLNTQYPNGEVGIFVTADTGHWYYWNGTAWADGGNYQDAKFYFDGLLNWLPGINLITGTSSDWVSTGQTWGIWSSYFSNVAGKTMTFSVKIKNVSGGNAFLGVVMRDASGNSIAFDGTATTGISYLSASYAGADEKDYSYTFTVPSNAAQIKVGVGTDAVTTSFNYSSEFFAFGDSGEYVKAPSDMVSGEAVAYLLKKVYDQLNADWSDVQLPGINLITGTSSDWVSTGQTWGIWSSYFSNVAGKTMTFSVKIKNVSGGNAFLGVVMRDASGNSIAFDGTATTGISYLSASYAGADEKDYSYTFTVPSNAAQIKVGVGTDAVTTSFNYSSEFFAFGDSGEYVKALSEYDNSQKIVKIIESINDRLSKKNDDISESNLPIINITGNYGDMLANNVESVLPFSLDEPGRSLSGYVKISWQGNSSLSAAKKGFKFKTYVDSAGKKKLKWRPLPSFYENSSFNLKGYYTDKYSVRDAVCAEIYSRFIANNPTAPKELLLANHFGTIQSMPCLLYFNKNFYGLMEMNTKSSSELWNMDKTDPDQIAIEGNSNLAKGEWREGSPTLGDTGDFSLDSDNDTNAAAALTSLASKIVVDSDDDFKKNIESIFDLNSICDVLIFNWLVNNSDIWSGKNNCYLTYDGGSKWFLMSYDFDSSLGSSWAEGTITADDYDYFEHLTPTVGNQLLRKFLKLYPDKVLARFNELDSAGVLNIQELQRIVTEKANLIGTEAYEKEYARWPSNPAYTEDLDLDHIKYMLSYRKQLLKSKLNAMQGSAS